MEESPQSSAAVIEVEVPTGYVAYQLDLERSIYRAQMSGNFPSLRDVIGGHGDTFARKTVWFFDYVSFRSACLFVYFDMIGRMSLCRFCYEEKGQGKTENSMEVPVIWYI